MMKNFSGAPRNIAMFAFMALLFILVGQIQSWSLSLAILNLCLISSIMALGVNIQWGYAGLLNVGVMGFAALGGLAAILISTQPISEGWAAGGFGLFISFLVVLATVAAIIWLARRFTGRKRALSITAVAIVGYVVVRYFFYPAVDAIESINSASAGHLGGLGMPILLSWIVGGLFAAGAAWLVGKVSLGLRSDYLAIATLGISEIIVAMLKNEDWLTRGVKNVIGLPRPVPYEVDIQQSETFLKLAADWDIPIVELSSIVVKLSYAALFAVVLLFLL